MTISDDAVEAAAKALRDHNPFLPDLQVMDETPSDEFDCCARIALEAAAPFIRAQALEDAAEHFEKEASQADMADAFFDYASGYAAGMRAAAAWIKGGLGWLI